MQNFRKEGLTKPLFCAIIQVPRERRIVMGEFIFYAILLVVGGGWLWYQCRKYESSTVDWVANKDY
jgi:hypothetical protein